MMNNTVFADFGNEMLHNLTLLISRFRYFPIPGGTPWPIVILDCIG